MLRVLRPLKLIKRNEGLKISLGALVASIPSIVNILLITLFFFVILGTMGVYLFKGLYYYCEYSHLDDFENL